jgi:hypothetical protein
MLLFQKLGGESVRSPLTPPWAALPRLPRTHLEHVQARPHSIFGLALECADRMQAGMNMRSPAGPGGEKIWGKYSGWCLHFSKKNFKQATHVIALKFAP